MKNNVSVSFHQKMNNFIFYYKPARSVLMFSLMDVWSPRYEQAKCTRKDFHVK